MALARKEKRAADDEKKPQKLVSMVPGLHRVLHLVPSRNFLSNRSVFVIHSRPLEPYLIVYANQVIQPGSL